MFYTLYWFLQSPTLRCPRSSATHLNRHLPFIIQTSRLSSLIQISYILTVGEMLAQQQARILPWIRTNFLYPNCQRVSSIADLRSGAAISEILLELLPEHYHARLFGVEVYNLTVDNCVANLRAIRSAVQGFIKSEGLADQFQLDGITGEGLYYRQQDMARFMAEVVIRLWDRSIRISVAKHDFATENTHIGSSENYLETQAKDQKHNNNISASGLNVSQLSDIANFSSLEAAQNMTHQPNLIINRFRQTQPVPEALVCGSDEQDIQSPPPSPLISLAEMEQLRRWVYEKLPSCSQMQYHEILGNLVNAIFCASRLSSPVIKEAHFEHGPAFVYRRALQFLLTGQQADKMSKRNGLMMMRSLEQGLLRQTQFWMVVRDIYEFDMSSNLRGHSQGHSRENKLNKELKKLNKHRFDNEDKENVCINRKVSGKSLKNHSKKELKDKNQVKTLQSILNYSTSDCKQAEMWLIKSLGLQHSLSKTQDPKTDIYGNCLLNGSLVGLIMMRLKIGKPNINKLADSYDKLKANWDQVYKISNLRGYQALKKLKSVIYDPKSFKLYKKGQLVSAFLACLKELKQQHARKNPEPKRTEQSEPCNECQWTSRAKDMYPVAKQSFSAWQERIVSWLETHYGLSLRKTSQEHTLTTSQLTQICKSLLSISLYKETTARIQANNVEKILGELRRIGLSDYYHVTKEMVQGETGQQLRWKILGDLVWVIEGKVEFCHA